MIVLLPGPARLTSHAAILHHPVLAVIVDTVGAFN